MATTAAELLHVLVEQEERHLRGGSARNATYCPEMGLLEGRIAELSIEELFEVWNSVVGEWFALGIFRALEERGVAGSQGWAEGDEGPSCFGFDFATSTDRGNYASVIGWRVREEYRHLIMRCWEMEVYGHLPKCRKAWGK